MKALFLTLVGLFVLLALNSCEFEGCCGPNGPDLTDTLYVNKTDSVYVPYPDSVFVQDSMNMIPIWNRFHEPYHCERVDSVTVQYTFDGQLFQKTYKGSDIHKFEIRMVPRAERLVLFLNDESFWVSNTLMQNGSQSQDSIWMLYYHEYSVGHANHAYDLPLWADGMLKTGEHYQIQVWIYYQKDFDGRVELDRDSAEWYRHNRSFEVTIIRPADPEDPNGISFVADQLRTVQQRYNLTIDK